MALTAEQIAGEQGRQDGFIAAVSILTALGTIIVILRSVWRKFVMYNFGQDDIWVLVAWIFTIAYLILIVVEKGNGVGHSSEELTLAQMVSFLKGVLGIEIVYYVIVYAIKMSILGMYLRFAISKTTRNLCYGTMAMLTAFFVVSEIVVLTQCTPLHKFWDLTGQVKGSCSVNTTAFFYATSAFHIITDVWILYIPIPTLWSIQRPKREKLAIVGVFGIGLFACVASIVRLHTIYKYTLSSDPFRDAIPVNLWSIIEINVGIICASMPALKQVISRSQRHRTRTTQRSAGYAEYAQHADSEMAAQKAVLSGGKTIKLSTMSRAYGEELEEKSPSRDGETDSTEGLYPEAMPASHIHKTMEVKIDSQSIR